MTDFIAGMSLQDVSVLWFKILSSIAVKGAVVIGLALVSISIWKRCSAACRHLILTLAIFSTLLVAVTDIAFPGWYSEYLPSFALGLSNSVLAEASTGATDIAGRHSPLLHWTSWLMLCWLAGFLLVSVRYAIGMRRVHSVIRRAEPVDSRLLSEAVLRCRRHLAIRRNVTVRESDEAEFPFSFGWLKPSVILPRAAAGWSKERIETVILHELAHIKRADFLFDWLAIISRTLYWFNPLIWIAVHRLRYERECATDDYVVSAGINTRGYARDLVEIARLSAISSRCIIAELAMAHRFRLTSRIKAILDTSRLRNRVSLKTIVLSGILTLAITLSLAGVQTWAGDESRQDSSGTVADSARGDDSVLLEDYPSPDEFVKIDESPQAVNLPQPGYPDEARSSGIEGDVWVKILVSKDGEVRDALILKSSGMQLLDDAALESAKKSTWQPATRDGEPVAVWVAFKIQFRLDDKEKKSE